MRVKSRKRGGVRGESVSVSHSFLTGSRTGLWSLGTLWWCAPLPDLVPRCCTSAENERGRWGEENQKQKKKVVGSGVVVLAHARCDEGQGSILLNYAKLYSN